MISPLVLSLLQAFLIVILAPAGVGLIRWLKARFQNRTGASLFQPYWALATLCRKQMTITKQASWVFHLVPFVVLMTTLALALLAPTVTVGGWFGATHSSIFLIAAILMIGSVFLVLGGMDVASAFGGMGASREMTLAALVEPAMILALATFASVTGAWQLDGIATGLAQGPWYLTHPLLIVTFAALLFVVLSENARYPVDNPATHLELTMVHEAMILEYSGPYLAMLELASAIKLTVLSLLLVGLFLPGAWIHAGSTAGEIVRGLATLLLRLAVAAGLIAAIESLMVKMRFYRMQEYMITAYFLALGGFALTRMFPLN